MVTEKRASRVIVAYKARLTRLRFETLRRIFQVFGTMIEVINREEKTPQEELVEDLITIVSHFAGKLYGMRTHRYREVVEVLESSYQVRAFNIRHGYDVRGFLESYRLLLQSAVDEVWAGIKWVERYNGRGGRRATLKTSHIYSR
jgi:hypothetical protein